MRIDTVRMGQEFLGALKAAADRGSEDRRSQRAETIQLLQAPDRARQARDATLDGLFEIYQKTSAVVIGLKEIAVSRGGIDARA